MAAAVLGGCGSGNIPPQRIVYPRFAETDEDRERREKEEEQKQKRSIAAVGRIPYSPHSPSGATTFHSPFYSPLLPTHVVPTPSVKIGGGSARSSPPASSGISRGGFGSSAHISSGGS